jgi:sugar phosphate isomerase/epimerase
MILSLSTCWNSHRYQDGGEVVQEARALGFEYIEISHGTKVSLLPGLMQAFDAGLIKVSSLHNFCPSPVEVMIDAPDAYEFTSHRDFERERALALTKQTIQTAVRFGAQRVVLHMGSVPMRAFTKELEAMVNAGEIYSRKYVDLKLKFVEQREKVSAFYLNRARAALKELLPVAEQAGVALAIETRSHFEQVPNEREMLVLLDEFKGNPFFGAWHDFGHVQRKANLGLLDHESLLRSIAPRLLGCHVHDVEWPAKDHRVPSTTGGVEFDRLLPLLPQGIPLVWEMSPSQRRAKVQEMRGVWRERYGL